MRPKLEGTLYIAGGCLHLFDILTDAYYVYSQDFQSDLLYYLSCAFLLSPSAIFLLAFGYMAVSDFAHCQCRNGCLKLLSGIIMAILEPFGMILCIFGCIITKKHSKKMDYYLIEAAARTAGFVEGVFESLPQLVV